MSKLLYEFQNWNEMSKPGNEVSKLWNIKCMKKNPTYISNWNLPSMPCQQVLYIWLIFKKIANLFFSQYPQYEYFTISTIVCKYAKSFTKFQNYLVFWIEFNFLKNWDIFFYKCFSIGLLKN